jgi:lysylphosphatidylglycerol synthetase-like protein (DUF2156 family)
MTENVQTAMFEILKKMQQENAGFRKSTETSLDRIEEIVRKQRRDSAGMLVMTRANAGYFDQRVSEVEARMDALDAKRS